MLDQTTAPDVQNDATESGSQQQTPPADFAQFTGGKYNDWATVETELTTWQQRATELEQTLGSERASRFPNERMKQMAEMYEKGATDAEVDNWLTIQKLDVGKMSPDEAIKMKLRMDYPGVSNEDIEARMERLYGFEEGDERAERLAKSEKAFAAEEAKRFLSQQIKASSEPESVRQAAAREAQIAQQVKEWEGHLPAVTQDLKVPLSVKDADFEYSFELPIEVGAEAKKYILDSIRQEGLPVNAKTVAAKRDELIRAEIASDPIKYLLIAARDGAMKERARTMAKVENNQPVNRPEDKPDNSTKMDWSGVKDFLNRR